MFVTKFEHINSETRNLELNFNKDEKRMRYS